ncbi:MAG: hypothetical protein V8S58_12740 [Lachnospiraceae bacterium]
MKQDARTSLDKIGLEVSEEQTVAGLPVGGQLVEIAREIDKTNMKLIVFDEPTAVLTEIEAQRLLDTMKKIASEGVAVIFISHKLNEIIQVSDRITVMWDGKQVCTVEKKDTDAIRLAESDGSDAALMPVPLQKNGIWMTEESSCQSGTWSTYAW